MMTIVAIAGGVWMAGAFMFVVALAVAARKPMPQLAMVSRQAATTAAATARHEMIR